MSEIGKARHDSLLRGMGEAGWVPDICSLESNPTRLWIYSVSIGKAPRLVTQAGIRLYREMQQSGELLKGLAERFKSPGDALASALREYDAQAAPDAKSRQALTLFLAFYACSTRTWQLVRPLSQVDGAHFLVLDWPAHGGATTVIRPAHHHQAGPMTAEQIRALSNHVLAAHLRLHPADKPHP